MHLIDSNPTFRQQKPRSNPFRVMLLVGLIVAGILLVQSVESGEIERPFSPTPTPTRTAQSFAMEGETHFNAGNLEQAIAAYREATRLEPTAELLAELARIQVYSSSLLATDAQKRTRLQEAIASADAAVTADPDSSFAHAVRAFCLDWYASPVLAGEDWKKYLLDAEQAAVKALQLDNQNTLALAYYAEILIDQIKLVQAEQYINQALNRDQSIMDVHRVYAYLLESSRDYTGAIAEYEKAAEIMPNLTFLYFRIGVIYRHLGSVGLTKEVQKINYDKSLEYFEKAVIINNRLKIQDPTPYIAISKTYSQMGEFFVASRNVKRALQIDPQNPDIYAQLGLIYFKARNYEGAIPALKCGLEGCDAVLSCEVRECNPDTDAQIVVEGMPLSDTTVVYYYTYGSVLSGLHRAGDTLCSDAMRIFSLIRAQYSTDPGIMGIVNAGEQICGPAAANP